MTFVVVGRRAMYYHQRYDELTSRRYTGDLDIFTSDEKSKGLFGTADVSVFPQEMFDLMSRQSINEGVACLQDLRAIKLSHLQYDVFWKKHAQDALVLEQLSPSYNVDLYEYLVKYWKEKWKHEKETLSLYKTSDEFFDDFVPKKYVHDHLHVLVAQNSIPVYTKCLKDGCEVFIDKQKFDSLSFDEQIRMFKEEIAVIALERWVIPSISKTNQIVITDAWWRSVHKTVTALTKNWASEFIVLNLRHFTTPLYNDMVSALEALSLKGEYFMAKSEYTYDQFSEIYEGLEEEREGWVDGFSSFLTGDGSDLVTEFVLIEYEGGEGKGERCESVFTYDGDHYKITYNYYSHHGFDFDYAEAFKVVPVERMVTFYERG